MLDFDPNAKFERKVQDIADGEYTLECKEAENVEARKGGLFMIRLKWQIVSIGDAAGQTLLDHISHHTTNDAIGDLRAVDIGRAKLQELCLLLKTGRLTDAAQFVGRKVRATVVTKAGYTNVKQYLSAVETTQAPPPQPATVTDGEDEDDVPF